jgi:hypothetical protein
VTGARGGQPPGLGGPPAQTSLPNNPPGQGRGVDSKPAAARLLRNAPGPDVQPEPGRREAVRRNSCKKLGTEKINGRLAKKVELA